MSRRSMMVGVLALGLALAIPPASSQGSPLPAESTTVKATPKLQSGDNEPYGTIKAVQPNVAYTNDTGGRVEVYTSAGNLDGQKADWRAVNEFSYLVNSVPKGKHAYVDIFNSLYDYRTAKLVNGDYQIFDADGNALAASKIFKPTAAFQKMINQYDSVASARDYVHVIGAKRSMTESYKAPSSLARMLYDSKVMKYCSASSTGSCITKNSSKDALMHSKYALFEQAADSNGKVWDNVVWVTSANLNGSSGSKKSNTAIAIFGDAGAYKGLRDSVWKAQSAQTATAAYKSAMAKGVSATDSDLTFYPSPRDIDFEARTLKAAAAVSGKTNCKVAVAQSLFSSARDEILNQVAAMKADGCEVKMVLGQSSVVDVASSYFTLANAARELIDRVEFGETHDKAITVSYTAGGVTHGFTWGGSANANGTSLDHDELAFHAASLTVTRAVEQQMERVYELARGGKTTVPVTGLSIDPTTTRINVGSSRTLQPRITPTTATVQTVTWTSSNSSVASVNASTGKVTAVAAGTATITGTTLSGNITASATVQVSSDSSETGQAAASGTVVNTPPTLTMDRYQQTLASGDTRGTDVEVTWGTGATDITGVVQLQYYDDGAWKTKTSINVSGGHASTRLYLTSSRAWRLEAVSANGASLGSAAKYSRGYAYNVVRTKENTGTPRIYAPTMVAVGDRIPFVASWDNPSSSRYNNNMRLQYYTGSKWKTYTSFTNSGDQGMVVSLATTTKKWRVVTSSSARPKGKSVLKSSSIKVKIIG